MVIGNSTDVLSIIPETPFNVSNIFFDSVYQVNNSQTQFIGANNIYGIIGLGNGLNANKSGNSFINAISDLGIANELYYLFGAGDILNISRKMYSVVYYKNVTNHSTQVNFSNKTSNLTSKVNITNYTTTYTPTIYFGGIYGNESYTITNNNSAHNFSIYSLSTSTPVASDGSLMWAIDMFNFELNGRIMMTQNNVMLLDPF
jgi:hypothetical protein